MKQNMLAQDNGQDASFSGRKKHTCLGQAFSHGYLTSGYSLSLRMNGDMQSLLPVWKAINVYEIHFHLNISKRLIKLGWIWAADWIRNCFYTSDPTDSFTLFHVFLSGKHHGCLFRKFHPSIYPFSEAFILHRITVSLRSITKD